MKNTYLIAILFLVAGLIGGQFLDLNINNQEGSVINSKKQKSLFNIDVLKATQKEIVDDPNSPAREYLCQDTESGAWSVYNFPSTLNGGYYNYGGSLLSCGAIAGNWA